MILAQFLKSFPQKGRLLLRETLLKNEAGNAQLLTGLRKTFFRDICQRFEQDTTMKSCRKVQPSCKYFYFSHSCPRSLHLNAHRCFSNFFGVSKLLHLQEKQQGVFVGSTEHCLYHPCLPLGSKAEHFFTPKPKMAG